MNYLLLPLLLLAFISGSSQTAADFIVTDTDLVEHKLYEDYLDKGITMVVKLFFVDCPPCNNFAPHFQSLYEEYGSGAYDVEFMELTTSNDDDEKVKEFKDLHDITFPSISIEGGASFAADPFINDVYGDFRGTPSMFVIAPDGNVVITRSGGTNTRLTSLREEIELTGATGAPTSAPPAAFSLAMTDAFGQDISGVDLTIRSAADPSIAYDVVLSGQSFLIADLAAEYPGITDPVLHFSKTDEIRAKLTPLDILQIRKHILGITRVSEPELLAAADTNGDGIVSPLDMLVLQKVIIGVFSEFPKPSHTFFPNDIPLDVISGNTQNIQVTVSKTGDMNGF